nr:MAG TPA: DNA methyltransferase [Caudoviricetes sp.]
MSSAIKPLTVLSLFDGMSCGQIALRDMGVPISRYYAKEAYTNRVCPLADHTRMV